MKKNSNRVLLAGFIMGIFSVIRRKKKVDKKIEDQITRMIYMEEYVFPHL